MAETRRLYRKRYGRMRKTMRGGGRSKSKAKKAARAAKPPKQRTQNSIKKEKAGRAQHAKTGKKTKKQKKADKKGAKATKKKKKAKKQKTKKQKKQRDGRGSQGSSGFSPPSLPSLDVPPLPDLPGGPNMPDMSGDSGNAANGANMGEQADPDAAADAAADQAAADSVNPADFGAQPPPYNAETCGNQMNYESEKCLAIRNVRAFRNDLFQQLLKAAPDDMNAFFEENADAVMKAYGDIDTKFQECLKVVEGKQGDCMACANGDQSKCPPQGENPAAMNVEAEGGTRRPRFKTRRGRRRSPKKI